MKKKKQLKSGGDPSPYDGPIERVDGVRPYNRYLWATEDWWANRELDDRFSSRFHFGIIALSDGRFSVEGTVTAIEENSYGGELCVFETRTLAIRIAAARLIVLARASRDWDGGLKGLRLAELINWVRSVVAKETGTPVRKPVVIKEPPQERPSTGFPLLDLIHSV